MLFHSFIIIGYLIGITLVADKAKGFSSRVQLVVGKNIITYPHTSTAIVNGSTLGRKNNKQQHHRQQPKLQLHRNNYFMSTKKDEVENSFVIEKVIMSSLEKQQQPLQNDHHQQTNKKDYRQHQQSIVKMETSKKSTSSLPSFDVKACWSKAGIGTCFVLEETTHKKFDIVFDIGCTPIFDKTMKASHVVLSHAHLDHLGGLFGHARAHGMVNGGSIPTYYIPEELVPKIQKARELFSDIDATCRNDPESQKHKRNKGLLKMNIIPIKAGEEIEMKQKKIYGGVRYYLRPFEVSHCGHPSYGYNLISKTTKRELKEEYRGMKGKELGQLVKSGVDIHNVEIIERIEALYTGDTNIDGLFLSSLSPSVDDGQNHNDNGNAEAKASQCRKYLQQGFTAPLVMCELTYLLESERELAKERGHLNLFDIEPILNSHNKSTSTTKENRDHDHHHISSAPSKDDDINQKFVFYHLSTRGKTAENILESFVNVLPEDVARRSEVALASFPSSKVSTLMKDNGCISTSQFMDFLEQK